MSWRTKEPNGHVWLLWWGCIWSGNGEANSKRTCLPPLAARGRPHFHPGQMDDSIQVSKSSRLWILSHLDGRFNQVKMCVFRVKPEPGGRERVQMKFSPGHNAIILLNFIYLRVDRVCWGVYRGVGIILLAILALIVCTAFEMKSDELTLLSPDSFISRPKEGNI